VAETPHRDALAAALGRIAALEAELALVRAGGSEVHEGRERLENTIEDLRRKLEETRAALDLARRGETTTALRGELERSEREKTSLRAEVLHLSEELETLREALHAPPTTSDGVSLYGYNLMTSAARPARAVKCPRCLAGGANVDLARTSFAIGERYVVMLCPACGFMGAKSLA